MLCAVFGDPIEHSLSPNIHKFLAHELGITLEYEKIKATQDEFGVKVQNFFANGGTACNITAPLKELAFNYATVISSRCQRARAANMLWRDNDVIYADNSDGYGLLQDLTNFITIIDKKILILGAGGASRGIIPNLFHAQVKQITVINRGLDKLISLKNDFPNIATLSFIPPDEHFDLIINATGTIPSFPIPNTYPGLACYDLSYSLTSVTPFGHWALKCNYKFRDGLGMLIAQAAEAFKIWHGVEISPNKIPIILQTLRK